jgi:periplasmic protein TonB
MFDEMIVSGKPGGMGRTHKPWSVGVSVIVQAAALGALLLVPLIYTQTLPKGMLNTFLVAPSPPAPPPPPAQAVVKQVKQPTKTFAPTPAVAPTVIPKRIEIAKDEPPPAVAAPDVGGVPGATGNVMGGIGTGAAPPPPPPPAAPNRVKVGGAVEAASLVKQVTPVYPPIAKEAHVSGTVVLHAIIAKDGAVEKLQYVSGPPLLMASAMSAVKEWKYRPTMLNGQPVEVDTTVQVVFSLG